MTASTPALTGLVLAGGTSSRMGVDKGSIDVGGRSLTEHCASLLEPHCERVYVSVRRDQALVDPYRHLELIVDDESIAGPAAGLLAAWSELGPSALLVLAVDMPLVDDDVLSRLLARRCTERAATAYRHSDGLIEPLCAIWEPVSAVGLREGAAAGSVSLRRYLEEAEFEPVEPEAPEKLISVNTPDGLQAAAQALRARG